MSLIPLCPKNSIRVFVVKELSNKWPQSAKSIHNKAKRHNDVSYSAVYKALNELARDGIVVKRERKYMLSTTWLQNVIDFSTTTKVKYEIFKKDNISSRIMIERNEFQ